MNRDNRLMITDESTEYTQRTKGPKTHPATMLATLLGRESGQSNRISTAGFVHRLRRRYELEGHEGCVNSVYFTPDGHRLLSGSDDTQIIIWDWEKGKVATKWDSGHTQNVFQARQIGFGSKTVVSCAADGQVRLHLLRESGPVSTTKIGKHSMRAHKLALDPAQPHCFYSSGEDAFVRHYDIREKRAGSQKLLRVQSCVPERNNQIVRLYSCHVNPTKPTQFAVGGNEEHVHIYDARMIRQQRTALMHNPLVQPVETQCPGHMNTRCAVPALHHVTSCVFSSRGELLVTYNNEHIYLFHPWLKRDSAAQDTLEDGSKRRRGASSSPCGAAASPSKKSCHSIPQGRRRSTSRSRPSNLDAGQASRSVEGRSSPAAGSSAEWPAAAVDAHRTDASPKEHAAASADADQPQGSLSMHAAAGAAKSIPNEGAVADEPGTNPKEPTAVPASTDHTAAGHQEDSTAHERRHGPEAAVQRQTDRLCSQLLADDDTQDLEDANNAAEELLRGLFDELVTSNETAAAQMSEERVAAASVEQSVEPQSQRGGITPQPNPREPGLEALCEVIAGCDDHDDVDHEADHMAADTDSEEMEAEDDWSEEDWDERHWLAAVGHGIRRRHQVDESELMPRHCLHGYVPEEPSTQWLEPRGDAVVQCFQGHKNEETVKGVSFLGSDEEYVASGSDCGHLFVWSKRDGMLRTMQPGDTRILNCIAPHPTQPLTLATSGIDDDVKIWGVVQDIADDEQHEDVSELEKTMVLNAHRTSPSSYRSRLFVPFLLGARWDTIAAVVQDF